LGETLSSVHAYHTVRIVEKVLARGDSITKNRKIRWENESPLEKSIRKGGRMSEISLRKGEKKGGRREKLCEE